jgi:RNA polymerase sigma-70 factor (ECF subfamily)
MHTESALVKGIKKKDRAALEELHDRYAPVLLGLCMRYCGNRADAEDVLHDAFVKILLNVDGFTEMPNSSFVGWMKKITVNTALNNIREKSKNNRLIELEQLYDNISEEEEGEELSIARIAGIIDKEDILQMICDLPYGYRTVFNMYVFEEYSHKEISEMLNCSESNSKTQLFKARAILRKQISEVLSKKHLVP